MKKFLLQKRKKDWCTHALIWMDHLAKKISAPRKKRERNSNEIDGTSTIYGQPVTFSVSSLSERTNPEKKKRQVLAIDPGVRMAFYWLWLILMDLWASRALTATIVGFMIDRAETIDGLISDLIQVKKEEFYGHEEWWKFVKKKTKCKGISKQKRERRYNKAKKQNFREKMENNQFMRTMTITLFLIP